MDPISVPSKQKRVCITDLHAISMFPGYKPKQCCHNSHLTASQEHDRIVQAMPGADHVGP